jgi:phospholipid/cholesterol/gamma-HCH transport system substrate-binding protein
VVGLVFAAILAGLVAATIWVEKPGFFKKEPAFRMSARFSDVAGLKEGAEVWVYGTAAGRVAKIFPDELGGVQVDLELDYDPKMRMDHTVKIAQRSALGGAIVSIHPGTPKTDFSPRTVFAGKSVADPFQEISDAVADLKQPLKATVEEARKVFEDFSKRSDKISEHLEKTLENTRAISEDIRSGKGTVGKLLQDDSLYTDLKDAVASIRKLADDAGSGGGLIDTLLHDKAMAEDLRTTVANVRTVSEDLAAGKGTIGKLFKDDSLYDRLDAAVKEFGAIAGDARTGKGVLGKLIYDEALAKRIDTITDDVAAVTGKLRRGEGTLGKLINDEAVYNDLRDTLKKLGGGVDDLRENAPVLTFAGFLFAGF